ncbi:hypothetical protein PENSPDRAFT_758355 [Peniophora sp. CONT]|nr:hypothetical protein PENSPDRAFT_758355 [Peniophora sp. CONT]
MKLNLSVLFVLALGAQASWFGNDKPSYADWDTQQLTAWLKAHDVPLPAAAQPPTHKYLQELVKKNWAETAASASSAYDAASATAGDYYDAAAAKGNDAYGAGQHVFQAAEQQRKAAWESTIEAWDESALRNFLLERGVVEPKGTREELALLAKQKYREYMKTMGSASAYAAQATADIGRKASEQRDWAYSTWTDSQFHDFLVEKGLVKSQQQATRDEMINQFNSWYHSAVDPAYDAWSDSYLNEWLYTHNVSPFSKEVPSRVTLLQRIKLYYYDVTQKVWNTWSDSEMKTWLVEHNIVKSDATVAREKLEKLIADNYLAAHDTMWDAWRDTDIRGWLVEHNIVSQQTADSMTREELVKKISKNYDDATGRAEDYLVWPDARLRAYLREQGVGEDALPTSRPGLLQEARIRWVQTEHAADALYGRILGLLGNGKHVAEEKLRQVFEILTGGAEWTKAKGQENVDWSKAKAGEARASAKGAASQASGYAGQKAGDAKDAARGAGKSGAGKVEDAARNVKNEL